MTVRIRLKRRGRKKTPYYDLVVADQRCARDGATISILGTYNPLTSPSEFNFDEEEVKAWLEKGAQPSDPVQRLLADRGMVPKQNKVPRQPGVTKKQKKEQENKD
ncbi:MAG: 30S ribosomal protein S16 [Actinobacteria bacterium]|nr:30S ribosomal protein S16 [Actinomycetota bacterium]